MDELQSNAMMQELANTRTVVADALSVRCVQFAAQIASLKQLIANMEKTIEERTEELKALKSKEE